MRGQLLNAQLWLGAHCRHLKRLNRRSMTSTPVVTVFTQSETLRVQAEGRASGKPQRLILSPKLSASGRSSEKDFTQYFVAADKCEETVRRPDYLDS